LSRLSVDCYESRKGMYNRSSILLLAFDDLPTNPFVSILEVA